MEIDTTLLQGALERMRTPIHANMSDEELERAIDEFGEDFAAVVDFAEHEFARARAIQQLRAREGRTMSLERRIWIRELRSMLSRLAAVAADLTAQHRDPAIVREAARFERLRGRPR
jgi:hypothetical protein